MLMFPILFSTADIYNQEPFLFLIELMVVFLWSALGFELDTMLFNADWHNCILL